MRDQNKTYEKKQEEHENSEREQSERTCDSVGAVSSSLSGAAPSEAPGRSAPVPMPRRLAKFSSRFAFRISTCCSSRRRRSSSGLNVFFALNCVRRCSGMYRSAIVAAVWRQLGVCGGQVVCGVVQNQEGKKKQTQISARRRAALAMMSRVLTQSA